MKALKSIFRATATDGPNACTVASVGSVKSDLSVPNQRDGQRRPATEIPEHLFAAPDRRCPNDPDLRQVLGLLLGHFGKRMLKFEFVPEQMIGAGLVVGLATSLATICLYENTGNLHQGRSVSAVSNVTRMEARVDRDKDEEQKSWRKSTTASIERESEMMDDRPQSHLPTQLDLPHFCGERFGDCAMAFSN
jgi:hypothetical protein